MNAKAHRKPGARFYPLLTRAQADEQVAVKRLADMQSQLTREEDKLQNLQQHAEKTLASPMPQNTGAILNRQAFIARLRQAIQQQRQQLTTAMQNVERAREAWLAANHNSQRYQRLIENEIQRAQQAAAGREQKEQDEIALRRRRHSHHLAGI